VITGERLGPAAWTRRFVEGLAGSTARNVAWIAAAVMWSCTLVGCDGCNGQAPTPAASASAPSAVPTPASASPDITPPDAKVPKRCKFSCKINGKCGYYAKAKRCVARSQEDCRESRTCRVNGLCTMRGGACAGGSDEDCRKSERCKNEGLCVVRTSTGIKATNCYAKTDADCEASERCKNEQRCKAVDGFCADPSNPRKTPAPEGSVEKDIPPP
jgi:hypothetical protein